MEWKNQLTRTPYLVLFIVLITVGVGTASALITITLSGNVIITDNLTVDTDSLVVDSSANKVGVGTTSPNAAFHVRGSGSDFTPNQEGIQITGSDQSGNSGIELTTNDGTPYIDFQNDTAGTDYDARIILQGDDKLSIKGSDLEVSGNYLLGTNQTRTLIIPGNAFLPLDGDEAKRTFTQLEDLQDSSVAGAPAEAIAPIYGIPDGAVIKEFSCRIWENDPDVDLSVFCAIWRISNPTIPLASLSNTTSTKISHIFSANVSPNQVFHSSFAYVAYVKLDPVESANCLSDRCKIDRVTIEYEVSKVD